MEKRKVLSSAVLGIVSSYGQDGTAMIRETPEGYVCTKLHYVPIVGFLCSLLAMFVPYCIAVYVGDVPAFLPFISDVGGDPPQSIIFGIFFGIMSYIGIFGMCLKYYIVRKQNVSKDPRVDRINKWTLAGGMCTLLGMLLVILCPTGHMRRDGGWYWPIFVPHSVGAGLVFVVGYVIAVLHLYLQQLMDPHWKTSPLYYFRLFLTITGITAMVITVTQWPLNDISNMAPVADHGKQYPQQMLKCIVAEWVMVLVFQVYVLTYLSDFRDATLSFRVDLESTGDKKES